MTSSPVAVAVPSSTPAAVRSLLLLPRSAAILVAGIRPVWSRLLRTALLWTVRPRLLRAGLRAVGPCLRTIRAGLRADGSCSGPIAGTVRPHTWPVALTITGSIRARIRTVRSCTRSISWTIRPVRPATDIAGAAGAPDWQGEKAENGDETRGR